MIGRREPWKSEVRKSLISSARYTIRDPERKFRGSDTKNSEEREKTERIRDTQGLMARILVHFFLSKMAA